MEFITPTPSCRILDVGVTPDHTLIESNFFERFYPYKKQLVTTSIEDASYLEREYPGCVFVRASGETLPFIDDAFDIVFCSAVLEHVGDYAQQRVFVSELLRVSKRFFITTPNRWFPVEFHTILPFIHWLPQHIHQAILRCIGLGFWSRTENLNLLTSDKLIDLFPPEVELSIYKYRLLGMPSNLVAWGKC
ncbi:MAG: methyltransferase domain-containing protein [Deltaproteobacteria bacterium]|nr:methyltransferase domain-containing protein [Deltaproteobacteria bacterium]MBW1719047.1 methyltransferase domain-containing protein [Deltaproteobacteria bacterium]MBW1932168.1 methyltransferase domain-containing protein [Deltaproteobacteria bacterium]MBW1937573.1 methyltransferase domain-containing protein [Deltaproteobacteria bacterium]MBW1963607.1 methyltransferase domain-containing protein [Deltaproteobacteria bacterium]